MYLPFFNCIEKNCIRNNNIKINKTAYVKYIMKLTEYYYTLGKDLGKMVWHVSVVDITVRQGRYFLFKSDSFWRSLFQEITTDAKTITYILASKWILKNYRIMILISMSNRGTGFCVGSGNKTFHKYPCNVM